VYSHADVQKNRRKQKHNNIHTEDKKMERDHMGPILKHQQNHFSTPSNLTTTAENETFTKD